MKKMVFFIGYFLSFCLAAHAKTNETSPIDIVRLNAQKDYLYTINQCANPKLYNQLLEKAMGAKDESKRIFYAAQIEEMIINNPSCFLNALSKLGYKKCEVVEDSFIKEPYFYPRHEIYRSLSSSSEYARSCFAS